MNECKSRLAGRMLLRPQQFSRQNDRYQHHQLTKSTRRMEPITAWGFFIWSIDTQFLGMGQAVRSAASGALTDGSFFELATSGEAFAMECTRQHQYTVPSNSGAALRSPATMWDRPPRATRCARRATPPMTTRWLTPNARDSKQQPGQAAGC